MSINVSKPSNTYRSGRHVLSRSFTNVYASNASALEHEYVLNLDETGGIAKTSSDDGKIYANYYFRSTDSIVPTSGGTTYTSEVQYQGHRFNGELIAVNDLTVLETTTLTGALTVGGATSMSDLLSVGGDLSVNTSALFVNASEGKVGINTSSPSVALDVDGAANLNGNLTLSSGNVVVASGDITITSGNFDVSDGNVLVDSGDIEISSGGNFSMTNGTCDLDGTTLKVGSLNASSSTGRDCEITYYSDNTGQEISRATTNTNGTISVENLINLVFDLQERLDTLLEDAEDE